MKIIPLHTDIKSIIKKASKDDRVAQKIIYDRFASKMLSICRMYINDLQYAEDVLVKGFYKVFKNIKKFNHQGSFEGWIRTIMIREAIDFLRSRKPFDFTSDLKEAHLLEEQEQIELQNEDEYIQYLLDGLPEGYRTVFILNIIEGYNHQEIGEMLGIAEGTSRSQLFKAKNMLREQLKGKENGIQRK